MDCDTFVLYLRVRVTREFPTQKVAAAAWGVSPQYLSDILAGHRKPGAALLHAVGFRRIESYEHCPTHT